MGVHSVTGTPVAVEWQYSDPVTGAQRTFLPGDLIIHQGFNPHAPLEPLAPLNVLRRTMQGEVAAREQNLSLFANDSTPRGVLQTDSQITKEQAERRAHLGIARTFQQGNLFHRLTVLENVEVAAIACGASRREAKKTAVELLHELQLDDWALHAADSIPHGVERRLGVARALAIKPNYVLLDEPAAGLNEGEAEHLRDTMRMLAERGMGVLLIDHNMPLVFGSCDHIFVLGAGKNVLDGSPEEIRHSDELATSYLGSTAEALQEGELNE
jgi:branched-chain amino acid transport system ATP-binding protein